MGKIVMTLDELKTLVEFAENQVKYHSMHSYMVIDIKEHPNGKRYIEFEQPCHYAECFSTYSRYDEKE